MREALGSHDIDSRAGGAVALGAWRALAAPALQATVPDLEFAHTVLVLGCEPLDDAPILELRIRKGVRRNGVKLVVASSRPERARPERRARSFAARPGARRAFLRGSRSAAARRTRRRRQRWPSCCATAARRS